MHLRRPTLTLITLSTLMLTAVIALTATRSNDHVDVLSAVSEPATTAIREHQVQIAHSAANQRTEELITSAEFVYGLSSGRVLTETERDALGQQVQVAKAVLLQARYDLSSHTSQLHNQNEVLQQAITALEGARLKWSQTDLAHVLVEAEGLLATSENSVTDEQTRSDLRTKLLDAQALSQVTSNPAVLDAQSAILREALPPVQASQELWRAEQEAIRLREERDAAARAEAARLQSPPLERSKQQPASAPAGSSPNDPAPTAVQTKSDYRLAIVNSGHQAELDVCANGWTFISETSQTLVARHWSCGASSIPTAAGKTFEVTGYGFEGRYRSEGIVYWASSGDSSAGLPGGYDLLVQSCMNGDSARLFFVGLKRL